MVVAASIRVPANIAIGLGVVAVAFAVSDSKFSAIAQPFLSLLSGGNDGGAISGKRQSSGIDEAPLDGFLQKLMLKHLEEEGEWLLLGRRFCLELRQKLVNGDLIHRGSLFSLFLWFFDLGLRRMFVRSKVILIVLPKAGEEIVESSYAGSIAGFKSTDDGIGRNKPQLFYPVGNGRTFHCNG